MKTLTIILTSLMLTSCCYSADEADKDQWKLQFADCELQKMPNENNQWFARKKDGTILYIELDTSSWTKPAKVESVITIFYPRK